MLTYTIITTYTDNDYILALAIARGSKKNNEESLARSFTYLFYAHGRGMKVMELFISQVLDSNDFLPSPFPLAPN